MIKKAEALEIARNECAKRAWAWLEPVSVEWGLFHFTVRTNTESRGGNVIIRVRKSSGLVTFATVTPR